MIDTDYTIKTKPKLIWEEYESGRAFKDGIGLYDEVEVNENMYVGKQWEGVNAPDLPKPVINITHLVVSWAIAQIVSDDIAVSLSALRKNDDIALISEGLKAEIDRVIEITNSKQKNRMLARNGAVHGDCAKYYYFDPDVENGQPVKGEIKSDLIEGRNVIFGNPYNKDVQEQPYNILVQRMLVSEARAEAKKNGMHNRYVELIVADDDDNTQEKSDEYDHCTVLIKLWRQDGTIWATKTTQNSCIRKPFNTGLKRYPIAWFVWEEVSEQFHGRSIVTGLIQNQISINRIMAMYIRNIEMNAWPKVIYDKDKFPGGWNNKVGSAISYSGQGGINNRITDYFHVVRGGDSSSQAMEAIRELISQIKEQIGASDAALGNVRPDNAQAIIAASQQAGVPMELPKLNFKDYAEQEARIIVDLMRNHYGKRQVAAESFKTADGTILMDADGEPVKTIEFDFAKLDSPDARLNVDVGTAAYWNEIMQIQTLDGLFQNGVIDAKLYVESTPDHYIPNKAKILEALKQREAAQQAAAEMPQAMPQLPPGNTPQTPGSVFQ
jgi:hypothetical protein